MELKSLRSKKVIEMKINFKLTILSVLIGISTITYAQELPQVVPPSPEASALFKFNEVPVSLHNGTHNTSIPLLDLSDSGVSLPITLSYHSQGVLLSDLASRVGTGWTLNYGGMISRQIRGNADENNGFEGYLSTNNSTQDYYLDYDTRLEDYSYQSSSSGVNYDYYPDKFMINSNFHSGEFYLDRNNDTIITQKFSDIKINKYLGAYGIMSFEAIDNQGNKYFFGDNDTNLRFKEREVIINSFVVPSTGSVSYGTNSNGFNISSWNLKKIFTQSNELIEFKYDNEVVQTVRRTGDINNQYSGSYQQGDPLYTCNFTVANSYQNVLKEIIYKHGKVKFISSTIEREDLIGGHALDRIEQYNTKNELVKLIRFNYFYTTGSNDNNNVNNYLLSNDTRATKRLFLRSIVFVDVLTNEEQEYKFEYDPQVLPNRHSNAVDAYGYYNGKNRGKYLIFEDITGNASVDAIKQQAGLLKKIVYPTGGHTVFKYEPNIVKNFLPNNIKIQNPNPLHDDNVLIGFLHSNLYNTSTGRYQLTFTLQTGVVGRCSVSINSSGSFPYRCYLRDSNNSFISLDNLGTNTILLQPGQYTFVFDPDVPNWNPYPIQNPDGTPDLEATMERFFSASIRWKYSEYDYNSIIYGPGCRIKKITHFSDENKEEFSREYEYVGDDNGISGYLLSISNYLVKHEAYPTNSNVYHNSPNLPGGRFSSYVKDNLSYFKVNEYFKDNSNNINDKTSYYYSLTADFGTYSFPNHLFTDNEWLRGKEIKKVQFKKSNNSFVPIRKIENKYILYGSEFINNTPMLNLISSPVCSETVLPLTQDFSSFPYIRNKVQFCYPTSTGCPIYTFSGVTLGYRTSFFTGGTLDLHESKVTEYFDNGQEMETVTTYGYDYNNHYNVASTSTVNSLGETSETKYQYASNISSTVNNALETKNMVGIPLITETFKNGEKLSTIETQYKNWDNVLLAPEFIKASKGTAPLETRIIYNLVDSATGNPLEVQKEGGIHICYIWGYNKTQPIAKIENSTYAQVQPYEANLQMLSNGNDEQGLILALNDLRAALPNAMITTYTYKPLIGISTVTDPKGDKQTYHYDGFGRLEFVTDARGNILSKNQYHYRTQN